MLPFIFVRNDVMTDPRRDRIFRFIFLHQPESLMHLLNSFLPLNDPIVSIEYMPAELHAELDDGSMTIVDVRCRDGNGRHFIVEMQLQKTPLFFRRVLLNASRVYSRQVRLGDSLKEMHPVYTLCLLDYKMFPESPDWIHHIDFTTRALESAPFGELHFTMVEMRKWVENDTFDKSDVRDLWMMYFNKTEEMQRVFSPEELKELRFMSAAVEAWDLTRYTERELWIMDSRIARMLAHEDLALHYIDQGLERGRKEGINAGVEATQKILYILKTEPNLSDQEIADRTGIEIDLVRTIRAALA